MFWNYFDLVKLFKHDLDRFYGPIDLGIKNCSPNKFQDEPRKSLFLSELSSIMFSIKLLPYKLQIKL